MSKRFLYLESKMNDTVVRVRVKDMRKVHGSDGWGGVGDEFSVRQMKAHRHGWTVTDEPSADAAPQFQAGDIIGFVCDGRTDRYVVLTDGTEAEYITSLGWPSADFNGAVVHRYNLAKLARDYEVEPTLIHRIDS